jgi:hypothetical protein
MSEINSPQHRRQLAEQQASQAQKPQPLRQFTVGAPEPEGIPSRLTTAERLSVPNEAEIARKAVQEAKDNAPMRITGQAKTRIEILANIGRLTRDVAIGGYTFSLRTLKAREVREASLLTFNPAFKLDMELMYEARCQQLARSIFKIDGQDIGLVLGDDSVEARLKFLDDLEESTVSHLFDEYTALKTDAQNQYGISTDAEAKEVSEDLKKA